MSRYRDHDFFISPVSHAQSRRRGDELYKEKQREERPDYTWMNDKDLLEHAFLETRCVIQEAFRYAVYRRVYTRTNRRAWRHKSLAN